MFSPKRLILTNRLLTFAPCALAIAAVIGQSRWLATCLAQTPSLLSVSEMLTRWCTTAIVVSGETWEWDGRQWRQNAVATTSGRFNSVMAYDESRAMVIRFGGRYGGKPFGDTWEYDGRQWKQLSTTGPRARNHAAMVYVANRKRVVLFGGHDGDNVFGDMWQRDGRKWRETEKAGPEKRIENGH